MLFWARVTGEVQVAVRPAAETPVRLMLPAKLKVLFSDRWIETPVWPTFRSTPVALTMKSPTWTVIRAMCETVPGDGDPVMVTL